MRPLLAILTLVLLVAASLWFVFVLEAADEEQSSRVRDVQAGAPRATVVVHVEDLDGAPVADAALSLLDARGTTLEREDTDVDGLVRVSGVPTGSVLVVVEKGGRRAEQPLELAPGEERDVRVVL